jgi:hypothetical protein
MQRPIGITITAILMVFNACADIVLTLLTPHAKTPETHFAGAALTPLVIAIHVVIVALFLFGFATVWFYWRGRSWARWVTFACCIFYITGLRLVPQQWHRSPLGAALTIFSALLSVFLIWYLYRLNVRLWFHERSTAAPTNK